ncbi:PEP/pyruvate-binding domain-containing protein [Maridesulfovibrio hydrothermalis]|uniref:Phosphoenolpyruvate synthase n=1 Tax=Maridesulfovibrio hydrothermalis AM13 = DSM 14728 TaxID=1121451 RepID=L0RBF6_9BACT|nr:PEP/pyruvate-binding domain-containing protein [Maridesulfovibrio hydrothermalis]CCO24123.1 Pyruvate, water dikinase [Maridesulfovibrio hydrothermalis AM13 = DSM 14728]
MDVVKVLRYWAENIFTPRSMLQRKYESFKALLEYDSKALNLIADLEEIFYGEKLADRQQTVALHAELADAVEGMIRQLLVMNPLNYHDLPDNFQRINTAARTSVIPQLSESKVPYIISLAEAGEQPHLAGGKGANLGKVFNLDGINVPTGFVITANAFHYFIEYNGLRAELDKRLCKMEAGKRDLLAVLTLEIQELILAGELPPDLVDEMEQARCQYLEDETILAVRSSALAEDSEISFAGQYASELNIAVDDVVDAYKRVLAGKYCPRAVSYRIVNGLTDSDTAMAVLIIPMIDARSAGVIYSIDPDCLNRDSIGIYGVSGLGNSLVDGSVVPAKASLHREQTPRLVSECAFDSASLPDEKMLVELARCALRLEEYFGCPQDVEWAIDQGGEFHILQTRPLQQEHDVATVTHGPIPAVPYIDGLERASAGAGCGEIYFARTGEEIARIPEGCVIITPTLKPALLTFAGNINAVLSATGSRASHFASVAREMGIPVLVGDVMERFKQGQLVTVDGMEGAVFEGCVEDVLTRSFSTAEVSSRVLDLYKDIIPHTVKLTLTDPQGDNFSAQGCRSLHDLVRFCHEKSINEMFSLVDKRGLGMGRAKQLETGLPLVLYVIDLDRGLSSGTEKKKIVRPDDISSTPMQALWLGLADKRVPWSEELTHVDWEEFDRMSAGIFNKNSKILASYGILAKDYLHLLVRFGYHLSEVDSLCGDDAMQNYIKFRFKGGGAGIDNRLLRLQFISQVLNHYGFEIKIRGDMLDAVSARLDRFETERQLSVLGYLMAVTRLMDMRMVDNAQVDDEVSSFIKDAENIDG